MHVHFVRSALGERGWGGYLILIAFITGNSSLEPLIAGLVNLG